MGKRQAKLLGRTTSYRLNAYDDAEISQMLVDYVAQGTPPEGEAEVARRARDYVAETKGDRPGERLLVKAYTLKWFNGLADLMWARFQEGIFRLEPLIGGNGHYDDEHEHGPVDLLFWAFLIAGRLDPIEAFVTQYHPLTLSPRETVEEVIAVQHANTEANKRTHQQLMEGVEAPHNPKVGILQHLAEKRPYPQAFLAGAAQTQIAAGSWDKAFTAMLRLRF